MLSTKKGNTYFCCCLHNLFTDTHNHTHSHMHVPSLTRTNAYFLAHKTSSTQKTHQSNKNKTKASPTTHYPLLTPALAHLHIATFASPLFSFHSKSSSSHSPTLCDGDASVRSPTLSRAQSSLGPRTKRLLMKSGHGLNSHWLVRVCRHSRCG